MSEMQDTFYRDKSWNDVGLDDQEDFIQWYGKQCQTFAENKLSVFSLILINLHSREFSNF